MKIKFEPRDLWIGVYVDTRGRKLYLCVLPCIPIILTLGQRAQRGKESQ